MSHKVTEQARYRRRARKLHITRIVAGQVLLDAIDDELVCRSPEAALELAVLPHTTISDQYTRELTRYIRFLRGIVARRKVREGVDLLKKASNG